MTPDPAVGADINLRNRPIPFEMKMPPRLIPQTQPFGSAAEETLYKVFRTQLPPEAFFAVDAHLQSHDHSYEAIWLLGVRCEASLSLT